MANYANFLLDAGSFVESHRVGTVVNNSYTNQESKLWRQLKGIRANDRILGGRAHPRGQRHAVNQEMGHFTQKKKKK